jgi:hypothetical protein
VRSLVPSLFIAAVGACSPVDSDANDNAIGTNTDMEATGLEGDVPMNPSAIIGATDPTTGMSTATAAIAAAGPQVVYVNFEGPTICSAPTGVDDSATNRSWLICAHFGVCHGGCINFEASSANRAVVLSSLRDYYSRYNVDFVTTRPTSGDYEMLVISPHGGPHHGVGSEDCGNSSRTNIAFVYLTGDNFYPSIGGGSRAVGIAMAGAHELGHTFGIGHRGTPTEPASDHMDVWSRGHYFNTGRTSDTANCVGMRAGVTQNSEAILAANLGLR